MVRLCDTIAIKKIFIFGIVSILQIHLYGQVRPSEGLKPWANQVADFVEKSPELLMPQQKESFAQFTGIGTPIIRYTIG